MLLFLVMGYLTGGPLFYAAATLSILLLAGDYARLWSMRDAASKISVKRSFSSRRLQPEMSTILTSQLTHHGAQRLRLCISQPLGDLSSPDAGEHRLTMTGGSVATIRANITASKLGVFTMGPLVATIESWLFKDSIELKDPDKHILAVEPGTSVVRPSTVLRSSSTYSDIFENVTERSGGSDFSGVRRYIGGDSIRNIDWAMSSRAGYLIVRQYEEGHTTPVCFLVDVDASMGVGEKTELESAAGLIAMLTDRLRMDNESVGLACFSRTGINYYLHMGMGRDHVAALKKTLVSLAPVASMVVSPAEPLSVQELRNVGKIFNNGGVLDSIIEETLKNHIANVKSDGFSQAVLKVSRSTPAACHIVVITNLSMGLTSLLNGVRMAGYYGHSVSVVLTPHIWYEEKEFIDAGRYFEEYMALKDTIRKLRGCSVKVIDLAAIEKPEDIIYASRIESRLTGIRG